MRLLVDCRIAVEPQLARTLRERYVSTTTTSGEFVNEIVRRAKGCALYIQLLLDMINAGCIQMSVSAAPLLPADLSQLYLLYFNSIFR